MGSYVHSPFQGQDGSPFHSSFVSGVSAAGDVGRGDVLHQRGFLLGVFEFAHVAVEIDHKNPPGPPALPTEPAARPPALLAPAIYRAYNHFSCSCRAGGGWALVGGARTPSSRGGGAP